MSVLFVTHCQPGPLLGGGPRRTYQLFHELREYFGPDQVALISSGDLFPNAAQPRMTFRRYLTWVIARSRGTIANPFKLFLQNQRAPMHLSGAGLRRYHQAVKVKRPTLCILEGP